MNNIGVVSRGNGLRGMGLAALVGCCLPMAALATTTNDISLGSVVIAVDGDYVLTGSSASNTVTVSAGVTASVTLSNLSITSTACAFSIASNATATLTLLGSNILASGDVYAGLQVPEGATLVITSNSAGSLSARGSLDWSNTAGAGIGGSGGGGYFPGESCGTITIYGGTVMATGAGKGAGIGGGGSYYAPGGSGGTIAIYDGTITATGGDGAGIGGGGSAGAIGGSGGAISICGGMVTATCGHGGDDGMGAGIGGGYRGDGGTITISGGTVTASSSKGAGMGGGYEGACGTIAISGGIVTANGGGGAGIGGGPGGVGGSITISDGTVTATSEGSNAGIGGGLGSAGTITISGGTVTATGADAEGGTGIGGGENGAGWTITISGGTVVATAGAGAYKAGIDSGTDGTITILGGNVTATGCDFGAGIGDYESVGTVIISGGMVTATGHGPGAGIGGATIAISDGTVMATGGDSYDFDGGGPGIGCYYSRGMIQISGGTVTAIGGNGVYGGSAGIGGGFDSSGGIIIISGGRVTATGGIGGAGIGGGIYGAGGTITISNGTVTATGGDTGAGIGGGGSLDENRIGGSGGAISIGGNATVTAVSGGCADGDRGGGAGIGGGRYGSGGTITISGGTVSARAWAWCGAGIGAGYPGSIEMITIMRCATVEAMSDGEYSPALTYCPSNNACLNIEEGLIIRAGTDELNSGVVDTYNGGNYAFINPGPIVPVEGISDVPTITMPEEELALSGVVIPSNATFAAIDWRIKDTGTAGATLSSNLLYCAQTGTVVLTATIFNGLSCGANYEQDFPIIVQIPHTIDAMAQAGGTITPFGPILVWHGASTNFLVEASNAHHIAQVLVDGTNTGFYTPQDISAEIVFSNVVGNHTLVASFNHFPAIVLTASPTSGVAPLRVAVDFSGSSDPDGAIARSEFDKDGDGLFETVVNGAGRTVVTYPEPGIYTATGVVYDAYGASASSAVRIEVLGRNPEAVLTASPTNGAAPLSVSFDGTNSTAAANRRIVVYEWDFNGDGRIDRITATGLSTHVYASPGNYQAVLRVTDDQGLTGSATLAIAVEPPVLVPPAVALTASTNAGYLPLDIAFTAEAADDGQVVQYRWDFEGDGSIDLVFSNNAANYRYTVAGTYNPRVVVVDNDGLSASDTLQIQVSAEPEKYKVWLTQPKDGDRIWGNAVTIDGHVAPAKDTVSVQFQYKPAGEAVWLDLGAPIYPQPRDYKTAWDVTGLADGATYHLRAVATLESQQVATSGVYAVIVDSSEDKTPGKVKEDDTGGVHTRKATFDSGQTLNTRTFDGTGVVIPAGTVESNTTVEIVLVGANTNDANGSVQGQANISANRKVSLESDPELSQMLTITIPYPDADQNGYVDGTAVPELTLTVHWYDTDSGQWRKAYSSTVYPDDNYVQAVVHHLTEFGVFGTMNLLAPANGGVLETFTSESPDGATKALNLTDGNTVSYWRSESTPETNQVFVYSFTNYMGAVLTKAVFNNYGDNGSRDFEVQTSMDGVNFDTVASGTLLNQESAQEFPIGNIACRTVKLVVSSGAAADAWELAEFAVHGVMTDDPDDDGMPDWWEMQYFGDFSRDGTGDYDDEGLLDGQERDFGTSPLLQDTDGDGQSDWAESIAGTAGTNDLDFFSIKEIGSTSEATGPFVLYWDSVTGRTYRLFIGGSVLGGWSNVLQVTGDGHQKNYTNESSDPVGFFRLTVEKP